MLVQPERMATKGSGRAAVSVSHTHPIAVNPSQKRAPPRWSRIFSFRLPLPAIRASSLLAGTTFSSLAGGWREGRLLPDQLAVPIEVLSGFRLGSAFRPQWLS